MKKTVTFFIAILLVNSLYGQVDECTIGVAMGSATSDGRPMVWKTRDYETSPDNEVKYFTTSPIKFISVINAGSASSSWMGVNEHGFAIVNSNSTDLPDGSSIGPGNGSFMLMALGNCKNISEFEALLDATNITGRTTNANFGVIDSAGGAAIYETANKQYWKFDAQDSPSGYVLRTNFAINGGGSSGTERLVRSVRLIGDFYAGDSLSYRSILRYQMRDFSNYSSEPVTIPFNGSWGGMPVGYVETSVSICRNTSVSAAVIHGILPGEMPGLSTMWTILGQPATSIALPYWPGIYPPDEADGLFTSSLCDIALSIKDELFDLIDKRYINSLLLKSGNAGGLWRRTFPFEDDVFSITEEKLNKWRNSNVFPEQEIKFLEDSLASVAYALLVSCYSYLTETGISSPSSLSEIKIYPNPAGDRIFVESLLKGYSPVKLIITDINGKIIYVHTYPVQNQGRFCQEIDLDSVKLTPGIYFLHLSSDNNSTSTRFIKINGRNE